MDSLRRNHVSLFLIVLFLFYGFLVREYDGVLGSLIVITILIHAFIFVFFRTGLQSLLLLVGSVFLFGGFGVYYFYNNPELFTMTALFFIMAYSVSLFIIWYLLYDQKVNHEIKENLETKVNALEKYNSGTYIYKMREFEDRSRLIMNGCLRRKEDGYFVVITDQSKGNKVTKQALHRTIGNVLIECTRTNFDIIGEIDSQSYVVLLQKISKDDVEIVLSRFHHKLGKIVAAKDVKLSIEMHHLYDYKSELEEAK